MKLQKKSPTGEPIRVAVLPISGFALMSYACVVEPLRAANLLARRKLFEIFHVAPDALVSSSGAAQIACYPDTHIMDSVDLNFVIAGGDPFAFREENTLEWLRRSARRGALVGGVSGGPVILAKAGLMKDRRMTVHWEHAPELIATYPDALVERRLYVIDRDRVTCGGGTAALDMQHALIAGHYGADLARQVSDWFLHTDIRAAAAPQRSGIAERIGHQPAHVIDAVAAMEDHMADPLTLTQLALMAGITTRQLNRLFRDNLGATVMAYYRQLRLNLARDLTTKSAMSVASIAEVTGFSTTAHFSNRYREQFGVRPLEDRRINSRPDPLGSQII
ncbi:MAG: helix-turn-helix domain-containing protein [Boseongicola sp.]|nr:MAG: helix-turn-helix domain-containing protein [Boseongicola sp.]